MGNLFSFQVVITTQRPLLEEIDMTTGLSFQEQVIVFREDLFSNTTGYRVLRGGTKVMIFC
jgi:hypothetical protein